MPERARPTITVVGAGLSGLFASVLLARRGFPVVLYERDGDPRQGSDRRRPSLNLALSERGLTQLALAGLREDVLDLAASARGRLVHDADGRAELELYGGSGQALHFILRRDLTSLLLGAAAALPNIAMHFGQRCVGVEPGARRLHLRDGRTGASWTAPAAIVVGADGARSVVRSCLQRLDRFEYSQSYLAQGYKEMLLPAGPRPAALCRSDVLHVWRRDPCLLLGFPNRDDSLALSLHMPFDGAVSFASARNACALRALFAERFPDVGPPGVSMTEQFLSSRPNSMVTIRCRPWSLDGRLVLLGDAAHAMVPHYGQGATMGLEDASALADCLEAYAPDWHCAFREYEERRRPDSDAMADLSLEHVEVLGGLHGHQNGAPAALADRALRAVLEGRSPSLYTLVAFTQEPLRDVAAFNRWWRDTVRDVLLVAGARPTPEELRASAHRVLTLAGGPAHVGDWLDRRFPFWRRSEPLHTGDLPDASRGPGV